ncbi:MAG: FKBP-type peptidyl-prolyl cis-trans isomerase [Bacteroidetes bacterium]|nr:FKBP-type peptidyl-prolyl cis-trans isomerase [Bacteroidota bacterium]
MFKNTLLRFSLVLLSLSIVNCNKNKCDLVASSIVASAAEITAIQNHLTANGLTATQHSSGLFYDITNAGSGDNPNLCSSVTVKYKGTLLNGFIFDQSTSNVSFPLKQLIVGWQLGLPLLKKGGSIKLYVPPSLGYGSASQSGIPANSTLIFTIDLVGVEQ